MRDDNSKNYIRWDGLVDDEVEEKRMAKSKQKAKINWHRGENASSVKYTKVCVINKSTFQQQNRDSKYI